MRKTESSLWIADSFEPQNLVRLVNDECHLILNLGVFFVRFFIILLEGGVCFCVYEWGGDGGGRREGSALLSIR